MLKVLQVKGVPQGGSISNILSDIYLSYYESNIVQDNFYLSRYLDDLIIFGTDKTFDFDQRKIYSSDMILKNTN